MTRSIALLLAATVAAAPAAAFAQNQNSQAQCANAPSRPDGHQEMCFEGDNVAGNRDLANGAVSRVPRGRAGTPLIRMRLHYVAEMLKSAENL